MKTRFILLWVLLALLFSAGSIAASAETDKYFSADGSVVYENNGIHLDIQPKFNELITVEVPVDDPDGILFTVSETASLEAGKYDGAGWLFSIGIVSEEKLHEMMCSDMSGAKVFARDEACNYYMFYHPTDVRFERATPEELKSDIAQWSMLCEWANGVTDHLVNQNNLEPVSFSNSSVDIYVARAAFMKDAHATLSTTEFGPIEIDGVDGTEFAERIMQGWFHYTDLEETPDGEYVVLSFPDEDTRVDFFFATGAYARIVSGDSETLFQAALSDDNKSYADIMQEWYYAAAEKAGIKQPDDNAASRAIIEKAVVLYGAKGEDSDEQIDELLAQLETVDASAAEKWEKILKLWKNNDLIVNEGVLPDGLPDTEELCLVALGFQLNPDGSMRDELIHRLETLVRCAEKYPNAWIVCTGGGTARDNPSVTEAGEMAKWLRENGIDSSRIIVEDRSQTTAQNAIFTLDILEKQYPQVSKLAIVSSDYHIATGTLLFGAEAILREDSKMEVISNAAWKAPSGSLSPMFQAGALIELLGDQQTAYEIYFETYDIHEIMALPD